MRNRGVRFSMKSVYVRLRWVGAIVLFAGCAPPAGKPEPPQAPPSIDSLVLERTICFGFCPAYRLRISSVEQIRFESRNRGDSSRVAIDTAPPGTFASLVAKGRAAGFYNLPSNITEDRTLCSLVRTDAPTAIITIFAKDTVVRVSDYHGCQTTEMKSAPAIERLRGFESEIDSLLRSSRWVRPNSRS